ncbi:hypothetical protein B0H13DRAFT_2411771 [Mycena leptocephala]|nr:hypothetical protein B0H13DRAFT_2411771 [Mycena leptocephala]
MLQDGTGGSPNRHCTLIVVCGTGGAGGRAVEVGGTGGTGEGPVFNLHSERRRDHNGTCNPPDSLHITEAALSESGEDIEMVRSKDLKLGFEIDNGLGYFLHTGHIKSRAVIVKVFSESSTAQKVKASGFNCSAIKKTAVRLEKKSHPNIMRVEGISSPASLMHFIVYENAYWKFAEGPLAVALKDDSTKSLTLGFKMAGMNYLSVQGLFMSKATIGAKNFDIFLDINDRFLISINLPMPSESDAVDGQQGEDDLTRSWNVFNGLCQRILRSANRLLHDDAIELEPAIFNLGCIRSVPQESFMPLLAAAESFDVDLSEPEPSIASRREYVWRPLDHGQQSLATVSRRISLDLDRLQLSPSVNKVTVTDGQSAHRCAGYVREEITLATTTVESAVVSHDAPRPLEVCSICGEVVDLEEAFRCICGDAAPGSRPTVKCQICKFWSHSDCVGAPTSFTCGTCIQDPADSLIDPLPSITDESLAPTLPPGCASDRVIGFNTTLNARTFTYAAVGGSSMGGVLLGGVLLNRALQASVDAVDDTLGLGKAPPASHNPLSDSSPNKTLAETVHLPRRKSSPSAKTSEHFRSRLNNAGQAWGQPVEYLDSQTGPLNKAPWYSVVYLNRFEFGRGSGSTRFQARERAAREALITLGVIELDW